MNSLVEQSGLLNTRPVVINNLNISKPPAGEPTLLTLDELRTTFHEFGHALHGLFSAVTYPRFSGTNVPRDFVEYPSQVNEMWIMWPEVLANYARHHATGEALPQETVDKLTPPQLWGEGFGTTEYLGAALLDLAWHVLDGTDLPDDAVEFEARPWPRPGRAQPDPAALPDRLLPAHFRGRLVRRRLLLLHLERGAGRRHRGMVQGKRRPQPRERRFLPGRAALPGNSRDPLESFRAFRGRDADLAAAAQAPRPGLTPA